MTEFKGAVISSETIARGRWIINSLSTSEDDVVYFTDDNNFYNLLNAKVNVDRVGESKGRHGVNLESLYQRLFISPEASSRLVHHTTQRGIRTIIYPSFSRRFKINDHVLRYNRVKHNVFTGKIQAGTVSRRINWYAQVYLTGLAGQEHTQ